MTNTPIQQGSGTSIEEFRAIRNQWANTRIIDHQVAYLGVQIENLYCQTENLKTMPRHTGNPDLVCLDHEIKVSLNAYLAKDFGAAQQHFTEAEKWHEALRPE